MTIDEKLAAHGWLALGGTARIMGVDRLRIPTESAFVLIWDSMHAANLSIIVLVALCCTRPSS